MREAGQDRILGRFLVRSGKAERLGGMEGHRRNCVFTSAGHWHNVMQWLGHPARSWDLVVCYYGDDPAIGRNLEAVADRFEWRKGGKFPNLHALHAASPGLLAAYDHVWVMDDDIRVKPAQIERMFEIAARWDLWVCQPAFSRAGKVSHAITARAPEECLLRIVTYVEVTCPLFRRDKLEAFLRDYDGSLVGWGVDYWFAKVLDSGTSRKFAIVDAVEVVNPADRAKGGQREIDTLQLQPERILDWQRVSRERAIPWVPKRQLASVPADAAEPPPA